MNKSKFLRILTIGVGAIAVCFFSVLVFSASTLLFTIVCNYASIDKTILAGVPLYILCAEILAFGFYKFRKHFALRNLPFHRRYYSIVFMILSLVGLISSILVGTIVYGDFLDYRIIKGYPLIMLIINIALLCSSIITFILMRLQIKNQQCVNDYKITLKHVLKTIGYVFVFWYALDRLGAFLLMPIYYSSFDSAATIPYLIQCIIPTILTIIAFINKRYLNSTKFALIGFGSILIYSIFSLIFLTLVSRNISNLILNSISLIQHFERLITFPIDLTLMYGLSIVLPICYMIHAIFILPKKAPVAWK